MTMKHDMIDFELYQVYAMGPDWTFTKTHEAAFEKQLDQTMTSTSVELSVNKST